MYLGQTGKLFIVAGAILILLGIFFMLGENVKWLRLGRLPGDIVIQRPGFSFYFPIATMILISVLLSIGFAVFRYLRR